MSMRRPQAVRFRTLRRRQALRRAALLFLLLMMALLVGPQAVNAMEARHQRQSATIAGPTTAGVVMAPGYETPAGIETSAHALAQPGSNSTTPPPSRRNQAESGARPAGAPAPAAARLYQLAGRRYGVSPALLWALHQVESTGATSGCIRNLQGSGALGPFQFMPRTFWQYAVDADGDARPDICGFADSLFTAARYLKALGVGTDPRSPATYRALQRYGTDPARVIALVSGSER